MGGWSGSGIGMSLFKLYGAVQNALADARACLNLRWLLVLMLMPALRETEKQRRRRSSFRLMDCAETIQLIEDMNRCSGFCPNNDELK